jgi:solute carrier family 25 uncoupling protein 27
MKILLVSIACSLAETVTHPIDSIKTRLQLQSNLGIRGVIQQFYQQNGIQGFYKSIKPAIARHWIYTTGRVTIYEKLKQEEESLWLKVRNGFIAGGVSQFIASPADLIKIRIQGNPQLGVLQIFKSVYTKEGIAGLYKGWQPNVARAGLVNIGELVAYDLSKKYMIQNGFQDHIGTHFACSLYSGLCATILSTPADVVKSNYMNSPQSYQNSLARCILSIYKEKGIFYFWRGSLLNWIRLGPWQMIFWMTYENMALASKQKTF